MSRISSVYAVRQMKYSGSFRKNLNWIVLLTFSLFFDVYLLPKVRLKYKYSTILTVQSYSLLVAMDAAVISGESSLTAKRSLVKSIMAARQQCSCVTTISPVLTSWHLFSLTVTTVTAVWNMALSSEEAFWKEHQDSYAPFLFFRILSSVVSCPTNTDNTLLLFL